MKKMYKIDRVWKGPISRYALFSNCFLMILWFVDGSWGSRVDAPNYEKTKKRRCRKRGRKRSKINLNQLNVKEKWGEERKGKGEERGGKERRGEERRARERKGEDMRLGSGIAWMAPGPWGVISPQRGTPSWPPARESLSRTDLLETFFRANFRIVFLWHFGHFFFSPKLQKWSPNWAKMVSKIDPKMISKWSKN